MDTTVCITSGVYYAQYGYKTYELNSDVSSIVAQQYAPFKHFINSDNCRLFIELDTTSLFGNSASKFPLIQLQGVKSNDHQAVASFIKRWHAHLTQNDAFNIFKSLSPDSDNCEHVKKIDKFIGQGGHPAMSGYK